MAVWPRRYQDCVRGAGRTSPVSTSRDQIITVADTTHPVFSQAPEAVVRVPFFSNYLDGPTIPTAKDRVASTTFQSLGLMSGKVQLTSRDTDFVLAKDTDDETQSIADGLARFTRTWTVVDACLNEHTAVQRIHVEHPGTALSPVQPLLIDHKDFSVAVDVQQNDDPCRPVPCICSVPCVHATLLSWFN